MFLFVESSCGDSAANGHDAAATGLTEEVASLDILSWIFGIKLQKIITLNGLAMQTRLNLRGHLTRSFQRLMLLI